MKDKLERFIEDNREAFDYHIPPPAEKIFGGQKPDKRFDFRGKTVLKYLSRAAAVLLIFGLSYMFHDYTDKNREKRIAEEKMNDIYNQVPELKEAEGYYSNLVSLKLNEMSAFLTSNPEINKSIRTDLLELDSIYNSLKSDLRDNVANDEIIEAMIQNYRLKLEILEDLQAEIKHENGKKNEKKSTDI